MMAENLNNPLLNKTFDTVILLADYFNISKSTVRLYLNKNKVFKGAWKFTRLRRR